MQIEDLEGAEIEEVLTHLGQLSGIKISKDGETAYIYPGWEEGLMISDRR
jgi:beta-lactam-binding protein with PASTA domain